MDLKITIKRIFIISLLGFLMLASVSCDDSTTDKESISNRETASTRLPGEFEKQTSVWMQWPNDRDKSLRSSFVSIIAVIQQYEKVNLIIRNEIMKSAVTQMFQKQNIPLTGITFHTTEYDSIWIRDNGPVYVFDKNSKWVQDFGFNAHGADAGDDVQYKNDDKIPQMIHAKGGGGYENNNSYILERGNLEGNGKDIVMLNWDCQNDRNKGWSKERSETYLKEKFGASKVIWMEGHDPADVTTGHIDGMARFVNESTVVIAQVSDVSNESYAGEKAKLDKLAADTIAAGLTVERFPIPGFFKYNSSELPALYLNYLVGNGFVLGMAFGNDAWDNDAKAKLQSLYPERTVHMIEVNAIWELGGGIHCVTNDEPLFNNISDQDSDSGTKNRVPAEWELHDATWIQWPGQYEADMRLAFASVISVIQKYEQVHLLTGSDEEKAEAIQFITKNGVTDKNIIWHVVPVDNAWMRDNGPIYVTDGTDTWIQNWKFDAWGGNFGGDVLYENDNRVPAYVGEYLGVAVKNHQDYVLEKGNLESNGAGILTLGWDCQDDRNPGMTMKEHEAILKKAFGATHILWANGHWKGEGTTGHIDATARFINQNTLVIAKADYNSPIDYDGLAVAAKNIGLNVVRYQGDLNWLTGNGFILGMGEGTNNDDESKSQLGKFFPGREVYVIDGSTMAEAGGGIHCITNDQPVLKR